MLKRKNFILCIVAMIIFSACSPAASGPKLAPTHPIEKTPVVKVVTPAIEVVDTPTRLPAQGNPTAAAPEPAIAAQKWLAEQLGVSVSELNILSIDEIQWPDSCLGAAKTGEVCSQVITDGYKIVVEFNGKTYELHTNQTGSAIRQVSSQQPLGEKTLNAAGQKARQFLAQQLGKGLAEIRLQSMEPVDWPDGCLGVAEPGKVCTAMITPGYRIKFLVGETSYELHTDQAGEIIVLAASPAGQPSVSGLTWKFEQSGACQTLTIQDQQISFGECSGAMKNAVLSDSRKKELADLVAAYQSFSGATKSGTIDFSGSGSVAPSPAEQRSLAEWARLVYQEAESGRSGAAWGLVLSWHREGGIAGFCDNLGVYASGFAVYSSCKVGGGADMTSFRLTAQELEQLYGWIDRFTNFELVQKDPAVADAMQVMLTFSGSGTENASTDLQNEILNFAQTVNDQKAR